MEPGKWWLRNDVVFVVYDHFEARVQGSSWTFFFMFSVNHFSGPVDKNYHIATELLSYSEAISEIYFLKILVVFSIRFASIFLTHRLVQNNCKSEPERSLLSFYISSIVSALSSFCKLERAWLCILKISSIGLRDAYIQTFSKQSTCFAFCFLLVNNDDHSTRLYFAGYQNV